MFRKLFKKGNRRLIMKNKKVVVVGVSVFIVIFLIGTVSVFASGSQTKIWGHHNYGDCEKNAEYSHKNFEDKSAWFEKMGLSEDATDEEIIAVKKEYWVQHITEIKEKLGLPEDATDEEVKIAMQELKGNWSSMKKHGHSGTHEKSLYHKG
jgi:hypothetical protein